MNKFVISNNHGLKQAQDLTEIAASDWSNAENLVLLLVEMTYWQLQKGVISWNSAIHLLTDENLLVAISLQ